MTWTYEQKTGMLRNTSNPKVGAGYSGYDKGRNNPDMEGVYEVGPIPKGRWIIGKAVTRHDLGPLAIPLSPASGTNTFGRSGFFVHGDSSVHPGMASRGCIILANIYRQQLAQAHGDTLEVV